MHWKYTEMYQVQTFLTKTVHQTSWVYGPKFGGRVGL